MSSRDPADGIGRENDMDRGTELTGGAPILLVVSAPSGAGKTTLCQRLLSEFSDMTYSISVTTRPPRKGDVLDRSYVFVDGAEFRRRLESGQFLEHALVHGHWYGTPRVPVENSLRLGRDVLMDIDVQGAGQIRETLRAAPEKDLLRQGYIDVFISPPSILELRRRLELRGADTAETIERRVGRARVEMDRAGEFVHRIVNDDLDSAYARLREIVIHRSGARSLMGSGERH